MTLLPVDIVKILLAILIGGLIGAEREFRDKAAGFRTIIFICVGATLFTIYSLKLGGDEDPVRIAASIVSGVGFLGAGAILRDSGRVMGLTTASTIWLAAALGMGVGGGHFSFSVIATGAVLIVFWAFPRIEAWIGNFRDARTYQVVSPSDPEIFEDLESLIITCGLRATSHRRIKSGEDMVCTWQVYGSPEDHDRFIDKLLAKAEVKSFKV
jgi:putative Mg2+ transporter-C (MgtC) family protein